VPAAIAVDVEINDGLGLEIPAERKTLEEYGEFACLLTVAFREIKDGKTMEEHARVYFDDTEGGE
jgi:hypothetical protein